jgi:putative hydrolase of HD superfamily
VPSPESVGDHIFMTATLVFFTASEIMDYNQKSKLSGVEINFDVDPYKAAVMALFHEAGEASIGDITPSMSKYIKNKEALESAVVHDVLSSNGFQLKTRELFDEFILNRSNEARLVRAMDKIEMMMQFKIYEKRNLGSLEDFRSKKPDMNLFSFHPIVKAMAQFIYS